ncbi:MAG: 50S ribosome-binding GTPase [Pirellulales bacterium]|nr:50S ribosome-binding GTPase [Pirellulales bacterium]
MPTYQSFADRVRRLDAALRGLAPSAAALGAPKLDGQEWFELLRNKLLAELDLPPLLIAAVVGGTNIGKSAIFNCLAGETASAANPLAAGTKHPVCLVPERLADPELLARLFEPFELHGWRSADDPLGESEENKLFWRVGRAMPPRLLLLDVPDVDSDAEVNWVRAGAVRRTADVLVAVLTQQKYNDAAVKRFFRAAVEADKPIVVVFNQCDMDADAEYWPRWLATFREATGARPELVYAVPFDRRAAEELRLPFLKIYPGPQPVGSNLRDDLAGLCFDEIKVRTFRGALRRVLDPSAGLPAYLNSIHAACGDFSAAADALSTADMARVGWPSLPAVVLVDEIRDWWDESRRSWSRRIHGFYRMLGRGATWPLRTAWNSVAGIRADPPADFQRRERQAVVAAVEKLIDELDRLARAGNDVLRPRLGRLLGGGTRADVLQKVQAAHQNLPAVDDHYRRFLRSELDAWRAANPRAVRFLQSLDHAAALARPAFTVALFFTGLHFAGDLAGQAAGAAAGHLAAEAAIAGGIAGGGEALVGTTSEGVRQAAARLFGRLQARYARQRAKWLADWLESEMLGDLLAELRRGAGVCESDEFRRLEAAVEALS